MMGGWMGDESSLRTCLVSQVSNFQTTYGVVVPACCFEAKRSGPGKVQ